MSLSSDDIRARFLDFFVEEGHRRLPSAPLVPQFNDPSVLLTTAGMHPLKPYFAGAETPPAPRLTSCQKCFRTTDIDNVGTTARHLTMFEMLGNFSIGDYFKAEAIEFAWRLSREGFGFDPERIWVTVFEGDDELGQGPDEEAVELWVAQGVPRERIVPCPRSENFWQAGPTGPCGPCSELYLDRGLDFGAEDDLPGGENERFLEYWNLVFMQYDQNPPNTLTPLPAKNIDTGMGLNRMAAILQDVPSVFETDQFAPLMSLGEELSGRSRTDGPEIERALRILSEHGRAMSFLVADGVVPSNEDRGYILRRLMRRAIQQGRVLGLEPGYLPRYADRVRELMGHEYPELHAEADTIRTWLVSEEESFGRTLEQGTKLLDDLIARAQNAGAEAIAADDAFRLHDTYGFPFDLTRELVESAGLGVDASGFEALMAQQRARAKAATRSGGADETRSRIAEVAATADFNTTFTGYESLEQRTTAGAVATLPDGRIVAKVAESPFYAAGGGQISDSGEVACEGGDCRARVADVVRLGDDQALVLEPIEGELHPGERVVCRVDRPTRQATMANHTATHLLQSALRRELGPHVRQAGSSVGPDKLRFDFSHGEGLTAEQLAAVEDDVNGWILENHPVRAIETTLDEAKSLGAMALFGEKYGDVVRMVEVGDGSFSRELCGGTHVRSTAEIGVFKITSEGSSAANVRRIEAVTGPAAVTLLRARDRELEAAAAALRTRPEEVAAAIAAREKKAKELEKAARSGPANGGVDAAALAETAEQIEGAPVLAASVEVPDDKALLVVLDQLKAKLPGSAIVLGAAGEGRVHLVAAVDPALVERGVKAGAIVKTAAQITGGGGGGRDTMARAGGKEPDKLPEALAAARAQIEAALKG